MIPLDRVRELLAAATPGPWDNGALQVYSVAGCPLHGPGGNPLADASVSRCVCRVVVNSALDDDRPLIAAAPDLAAQVLTLAAALETAQRERDTARSALDELVAAVATVRDARAVVVAMGAQYNAAWDAASAPPTPSDCEAVAAALRASYEAGDALSAALDALLARCP